MDATLERLRERFDTDPGDAAAFEALEESHFVRGEWDALVALYERRLAAPERDGAEGPAEARARIAFRRARVLEERCGAEERAVEGYREAARLDPAFRPALQRLRGLYARRDQWDLALQVAEAEAPLAMPAAERAALAAEMGALWHRRLGDAAQARAHYERALEAEPGNAAALRGLAAALEDCGDAKGAAEALERAAEGLAPAERVHARLERARLLEGALGDAEAAEAAYRSALADDPACGPALDALAERAAAREQWPLLEEIQERRFELAEDAPRRVALAREAAARALAQRDDAEAACRWLRRALELDAADAALHLEAAEAEGRAGHAEARARHLERALELDPEALSVPLLRESAERARAAGDEEAAARRLRRAREREPAAAGLAAELAEALGRLGRVEELAELCEEEAARCQPGPERAAWLARLARQHEAAAETDEALAAWRRAFDESPVESPGWAEAADALERLYRKAERWPELREHLERAAAGASGARAAALRAALGELTLEHYGDPRAARAAFEEALAAEPGQARALRGLARVAESTGDPDVALAVYEREAEVTAEPERLGALARELVRLHEAAGRPEEALHWAERWHSAAPDEREPLELRARLEGTLGQSEAQAATLEALDARVTPEEHAALRARLAAAREAAGDAEGALRAWRAALDAAPGDARALRALAERLDARDRGEEAGERAELWRALAEVSEGRERREALRAAARLHEGPLGEPRDALELWTRIERESGGADEEAAERALELLEASGDLEALVERLAERAAACGGGARAAALELRRGHRLLEALDRPEEAARAFAAAERADPACAEARAGRERALRRADDPAALEAFLAERARAAAKPDPPEGSAGEPAEGERLELERAELLAERLGREAEARRLYEAVADAGGPAAAEAESRLEALLERAGDAGALAERWAARAERAAPAEAAALHARAATLSERRLGDPERAVRHLEAALALEPGRADCAARLAALHEAAGRPEAALRALEAEIAAGPEAEREIRARARAAELAEAAGAGEERVRAHLERVLELDPAHPSAAEALAARLEASGREAELARLLEARLAALEGPERSAAPPHARAAPEARSLELTLRLRLAALRGGSLGDPEGAIALLEPAAESAEGLALAAGPLAELYERTGREEALLRLALRAADGESPAERAGWRARAARVLEARGEEAAAADCWRAALDDRPEDAGARRALAGLYRRRVEARPLARLLEAELARVAGPEELPLRLELAELLGEALGEPEAALRHLRRALELDPSRRDALERALALAPAAERPEERAALLELALERARGPVERAELLAERGALEAGALARPEAARESFRAALAERPAHPGALSGLRAACQAAGDAAGLLDALERAASAAPPAERVALLEEGAARAEARSGAAAALPWLERLRALRPRDPELAERIAGAERAAGRPEARARSLERAAALAPDPERRVALALERAAVLEEELGAPALAASALETARAAEPPGPPELLRRLAALYERLGRPRERAKVLGDRLAAAPGDDRIAIRRERAALLAGPLARPGEAARELWAALAEGARGAERAECLRELGEACLAEGRGDRAARVAEAELATLDPDAAVFAERRRALERRLAEAYEHVLARPRAALAHRRALADAARAEGRPEADDEEAALLRLLRETGDAVELERRLAERLERGVDAAGAEPWRELARLRAEPLGRPAAAARAWRAVLERAPDDLEALRGLRAAARALGDPAEVARALAVEIELSGERPARERAALQRELGFVAWRELDATPRARRAFEAAHALDPEDPEALAALRALAVAMEDWPRAAELCERERERAEGTDPEAARDAALRAGRIARDRLEDPERALRAFERADAALPLAAAERAEWAELCAARGDLARFAELFAAGCDEPGARPGAPELLRLARALEELGRAEEALARCEEALARDPREPAAWDAAARLREATGDPAGAAAALAEAAGLAGGGTAAAGRLLRAARLAEAAEETVEAPAATPAALLERARQADPGCAEATARLALAAAREGRGELAVEAGESLLALSSPEPAGERERPERGAAAQATNGAPAQSGREDAAEAREEVTAGTGLEGAGAANEAKAQAGTPAERGAPQAPRAGPALSPELHGAAALAAARAASERDALEAAERLVARALAVAPGDAEALALRGELRLRQGDPAGARRALQERLDRPGAESAPDAERARLLALLGRAEAAGDAPDAAAGRFAEALRLDPELESAHAEGAEALERAGRPAEAAAAWRRWAERAPAPGERAERLLRAAAAHRAAGEAEPAESAFEAASDAEPGCVGAWLGRSELALERDDAAAAARAAERGLEEAAVEAPERPRLARLRARALERAEDPAAPEAWSEAAAADPEDVDAALAAASGRRARGDWRAAGEGLRRFVARHPGDARLAPVLQQLGRLLAGPLEDVDGAVAVYRRALELDPDHEEAREALADLLVHRPEGFAEALERHRALLREQPARAASLRAVLHVARERGRAEAVATGHALLGALESAAAGEGEERALAPAVLRAAAQGALPEPAWEAARRVARALARELGEALGAGAGAPAPEPGAGAAPEARFRAAATRAEGELAAPALVPLPDAELGQAIALAVHLAEGAEAVSASDGALVNALSGALGRSARRRVRRALCGLDAAAIAAIDWRAWRAALRGAAGARALLETGVELRVALAAWQPTEATGGEGAGAASAVAASPEAKALLARLVAAWAKTA